MKFLGPIASEIMARNLACPLPILELTRALRPLKPGEVVCLVATDPAVESDLRAYCAQTGHDLLELSLQPGEIRAHVRKRAAP